MLLSPTFDITQLDHLIREIVKSQTCTPEQALDLGKFYEQAKAFSSHGKINEALSILGTMRHIPELDPQSNKFRFLAEGYQDAIYAVLRPTYLPSSITATPAQNATNNASSFAATSLQLQDTTTGKVESADSEPEAEKTVTPNKSRRLAPIDEF